jgi:hypothetical protein
MLLNTSAKQLIYFIFFALTGICALIFSGVPAYAACQYHSVSFLQTQNSSTQLQVIITYEEASLNYKDPDFLLFVSTKIDTKIIYLSSVSSRSHAYIIFIPKNKNPENIIKIIKKIPNVRRVEVDNLMQHL